MKYTNTNDNGMNGRNFEVDLRMVLTGIDQRMHPGKVADIFVKRGVTLECKTGCGWLVSPKWDTKEEAEAVLLAGQWKMQKAMFVAYLPTYGEWDSPEDAFILTQKKFVEIFVRHGKVRVKQSSANGKWGLTIQSYIPTEKFKASRKVYEAIIADLMDGSETVEDFKNRMGL